MQLTFRLEAAIGAEYLFRGFIKIVRNNAILITVFGCKLICLTHELWLCMNAIHSFRFTMRFEIVNIDMIKPTATRRFLVPHELLLRNSRLSALLAKHVPP